MKDANIFKTLLCAFYEKDRSENPMPTMKATELLKNMEKFIEKLSEKE